MIIVCDKSKYSENKVTIKTAFNKCGFKWDKSQWRTTDIGMVCVWAKTKTDFVKATFDNNTDKVEFQINTTNADALTQIKSLLSQIGGQITDDSTPIQPPEITSKSREAIELQYYLRKPQRAPNKPDRWYELEMITWNKFINDKLNGI